MELSKFIIICVLFEILGVDVVDSLPTFGSEHVHIKVHLPPLKHTTTRATSNYQHEHEHVHHQIFHQHQRPFKNVLNKEIVPVLENFYLSELDKPYSHNHLYQRQQEPKFVEETFLLHTHSHNPKPTDDATSTIGRTQHPSPQEYAKTSIETATLIESIQNHDEAAEYSFDQYQRDKHLEEVIKVIEAPKFISAMKGPGHEPQVKEIVIEEPKIEASLSKTIENHNYDVEYSYISPERTQFYHFQEVPIYPDIPRTQHTRPAIDYLSQETQSIKLTSAAATGEEQDTLKYVTDYQKYLPSSENPRSFNESHSNFVRQGSSSIDSNKNHDNSHNDEANPQAAETYTGYDSYSAAHVQGLGSGVYSNHKLF